MSVFRGEVHFYASRTTLAATGGGIRSNFGSFARNNPVLAARWIGPTYRPVAWGALASYGGYAAEPVYYDYGETVVYTGDTVIINGEQGYSADLYAQQASDIATAGQKAAEEPKADFQSLGVFAIAESGEEKATNIFQLSLSKEGVIRGEYYNALTDTTVPVAGSVDKKTQRAAWTAGDKPFPLYEVGIANLTKDETTMLVHYSKENRKQFVLVRLEAPKDAK